VLRNRSPPPPLIGNSPSEVRKAVDHLFRREAGRLVAILARRFGGERLHLAEDAVQDALVRAMQTWPFTGVPDNPTAWILRVACNRALDQVRHDRLGLDKQPEFASRVEDLLATAIGEDSPQFEDEIRDSQLRMMFVCCHPGLPVEAQVALTLKVLCGFGVREIAAAFLSNEAAIAKRLVRARQFLRDNRIAVELPPAAELGDRLDAVLQALYLLFNEGYKASHGDSLLRRDLCNDAIRLGELITAHPLGDRPATHALLALMHFNAARLPARTGRDGASLRLAEQERGLWDREMIRRGVVHLASSGAGPRASAFHLEAGIAACHAFAKSDDETDWGRILELYDALFALNPSPVVALNRAVAVARVRGPEEGLRSLASMRNRSSLENYHLLHAVEGQLWLDSGDRAKAICCLQRAHDLATVGAERIALARRLAAIRA
jgi:RNA polymerase sigma factor (sigma-70 family)